MGCFYIEKNKESKYPLIGKHCDELYLNGCAGVCLNRKKYNFITDDYEKDFEKYQEWKQYLIDGFETRQEAEQYRINNQIDGRVYFYGGCGCCACYYEDDDGTVKTVVWKQFYPKNATEEEIIKLDKENTEYERYCEDNKELLNGRCYLNYGENLPENQRCKEKMVFPSIFLYELDNYGIVKFCIVSAHLMYFYYDKNLNLVVDDAFKKFIQCEEVKNNPMIMYFKKGYVSTPYGACCGLGYVEYEDKSYY